MTAAARNVNPGLAGRSAGWRIVAVKEFADHVTSARFYVLLAVLGLAAVVPLYFAADAIRSVASQVADTRFAFVELFLYAPSSLPIPSVFAFVGIVAPLLGVAFAFDAINAERTDGTLPRLLSQPIYRDDVINGKFAAGLASITLALLAVVGVIAGFGIIRLGIVPSAEEVLRLLAWLVVAIVWVGLWLAFGLLLSVVIRRAATAALIGFGVWLFVAIFGQLATGLIAGVLAPIFAAGADQPALATQVFSDTIQRVLPLTLYLESARVILNPTETTVSVPSTIAQVAQWQQQVQGQPIAFDQSLLLIWPHLVALVALTAICFAAAYVRFMRQEVRA
jgi:ABC-2 type transport system permease protein